MPREDPENDVAATKLAFIQGQRKPVGHGGRHRRRWRVAFEEISRDLPRYLENSEDLKVSVTELPEQLGTSEEAGISTEQVTSRQETRTANFCEIFRQGEEEVCIASWARWNAEFKRSGGVRKKGVGI